MQICERALAASEADETMVHLGAGSSALTRFANSEIHQNVAEEGGGLSVRAVMGQRSGTASGNDLSDDGIADTARRALALAQLAEPDEELEPLAEPQEIPEALAGVTATSEFGAAERAGAVRAMLAICEAAGQTASGAFSTGTVANAVATSAGVRAFQANTRASLGTVTMLGDSSGYASAVSRDVGEIDAEAIARTACEKAAASADPVSVEPGEWDVILEPSAVGTVAGMMTRLNFGAKACHEGRSAVSERMGERICGENITIYDDGMDPRGSVASFDYEGMPKQKVTLIDRGVAAGMVHDTKTAAKDNTTTTGHSTGPGGWGPIPSNIFIEPGSSSVDEMIASIGRGLLVTRFHYTNIVSPKQTVLTGMTRDGTFLIEDGRIAGGVKNLRFTQNILEALGRVEMIGSEGALTEMVWTPAMKIKGFEFTGKTEF